MSVILSINHDSSTNLTDATNYTSSFGTDITITAAAALGGTTNGLQIVMPGGVTDADYAWRNITADASDKIRSRFYIKVNSLAMASGNEFYVFSTGNSTPLDRVRVYLANITGTYYIWMKAYDNAGTQHDSGYSSITDDVHYIEIYEVRGAANDGFVELYIDGVYKQTISGLTNDTRFANFRTLTVGAVGGIDTGTSGTFYIDEIEINNTGIMIGPLGGPSGSESPSISPSRSLSPSASQSPSASVSPSASASVSPSASASVSPSLSQSASASPSVSLSVSPSASASVSPSISPSPSPGITAPVCWGHDTGVIEANIRDFQNNWTGTGAIGNPGVVDTERLELEAGEYMISEIVDTGAVNVELDYNHYAAGDAINLDYRTGATPNACTEAAWNDYVAPFASSGYVQIRVTSTL